MVKRLGMICQQKEYPYLLNIISRDPINYRGGIINLETGLITIRIEEKEIIMNFNILPLGNDKVVLGIPWLQEYNPKINWTIGDVEIQDI